MDQSNVSVVDLIKKRINEHGELHLGRELTTLLVRILEIDENKLKLAEATIAEIKKELGKL